MFLPVYSFYFENTSLAHRHTLNCGASLSLLADLRRKWPSAVLQCHKRKKGQKNMAMHALVFLVHFRLDG